MTINEWITYFDPSSIGDIPEAAQYMAETAEMLHMWAYPEPEDLITFRDGSSWWIETSLGRYGRTTDKSILMGADDYHYEKGATL